MTDTDIHSCGYYCDRPICIKAQRDELRNKLFSDQATRKPILPGGGGGSGVPTIDGWPLYSGLPPVKVQDEHEANYKSFAQSAQVLGAQYDPRREPSGSWVSWENTMCNPLAPARMQTQSAWADGYASAKKDERVIDKSMAKRIATQLGWEPKREWVGFTQEEHQSAIWTDGSFGAGFLHAEKLLKEKNT